MSNRQPSSRELAHRSPRGCDSQHSCLKPSTIKAATSVSMLIERTVSCRRDRNVTDQSHRPIAERNEHYLGRSIRPMATLRSGTVGRSSDARYRPRLKGLRIAAHATPRVPSAMYRYGNDVYVDFGTPATSSLARSAYCQKSICIADRRVLSMLGASLWLRSQFNKKRVGEPTPNLTN